MKKLFLLVLVVALPLGCATMTRPTDPLARSVYSDMFHVSDSQSARVSSWDRSGSNGDMRALEPGQTLELANLQGAGAIRHIYFTIIKNGPTDFRYLQELVLRMYWDGESEPSVEAPFGEFFGQGNSRINYFRSLMVTVNPGAETDPSGTSLSVGFNSYFIMPFSNGARITLSNEGKSPVGAVWYHIDYETFDALPPDVERFHAQYRQAKPTTPMGDPANYNICSGEGRNLDGAGNYVILDARGRGNLVGYFLNVDNFAHTWYGEGDDMIFIDGDTWPPSFHGTGTEEIFGGGACPNVVYTGPYTGFHHIDNKDFFGTTSMYRFYVVDPIHFQKSIRVTIEHGHNNNFGNDYSSCAFWYQTEPHAPFAPLPPLVERLTKHDRDTIEGPVVPEGGTAIEPTSDAAKHTAGWHRYAEGYLQTHEAYWAARGDGSEVFTWQLAGVAPGTYEVSVWVPDDPRNDHAPDAPFTVRHVGGVTHVVVDLTKDYRTWHPLGTFTLDASSVVELTNKAGGNVTANDVLLVPVK